MADGDAASTGPHVRRRRSRWRGGLTTIGLMAAPGPTVRALGVRVMPHGNAATRARGADSWCGIATCDDDPSGDQWTYCDRNVAGRDGHFLISWAWLTRAGGGDLDVVPAC